MRQRKHTQTHSRLDRLFFRWTTTHANYCTHQSKTMCLCLTIHSNSRRGNGMPNDQYILLSATAKVAYIILQSPYVYVAYMKIESISFKVGFQLRCSFSFHFVTENSFKSKILILIFFFYVSCSLQQLYHFNITRPQCSCSTQSAELDLMGARHDVSK